MTGCNRRAVTWARLGFVLAVLSFFAGSGATAARAQVDDAASEESASEPEPVTVDLARAARAQTSRTRDFVGRVVPLKVVDLAFQVSGQIFDLPITDGETRQEGALLARLDTVDFELAVEQARTAYDLAEIEFNRASQLAEREAAAQSRLDQARADRTQADIALREAERRLDQATITAPFDALVARVIAERFINTTPSEPVVRLQDISEMRVIVSLPEEIAALARADSDGFGFTATFPAVSGYEAELSLREFVTEADPVAQTYQVEFAITGEVDTRLLPGMTAEVNGVPATDGDMAPVVIPVGAVDTTGSADPRVWVFDDETTSVSARKVALGLPRDGSVVVLEGLSPGDLVVSAGWTRLTDGAPVRPSGR